MKKITTTLLSLAAAALLFTGCGPITSASEASKMTESANNLKMIGIGIKMYAANFAGKLPTAKSGSSTDCLSLLLQNKYVTDCNVFVNPSAGNTKAAATGNLTTANTSYAYLGNGLTDSIPDNTIIALEIPKLMSGSREYVNVLFAAGYVESISFIDVNKKSCTEIVQFVIQRDGGYSDSVRKTILENAKKADQEFSAL